MMLSETSKPKGRAAPGGARARGGAGKRPRATAVERRERIQMLWAKARTAARSARLLGDAGDPDGAINRAYYAAFGAARAALATARFAQASSKQHGTIYRRFDKLFVQERGLDPSLGRPVLQRLSSARAGADYGKSQANAEAAQRALGEMERFIAAVEPFLQKLKP
jgi:uncharacterized protein (UPF0332 family)